MKRNRLLLLSAFAASQAFAQSGLSMGTGSVDPVSSAGVIVSILGRIATVFFIAAIIWTSIQGAIADHDHFHKLPKLFLWGGICAGATLIVNRIATGA